MASDVQVRSGETTTTTAAVDARTCPECDGTVRPDGDESICSQCGLVVQEDRLDRGPDWFGAKEADPTQGSTRHNGPASTEGMHDGGLATDIGFGDLDANGNRLSNATKRRLVRMRTWHNRCKFESKRERNLGRAIGEIGRMGSALDVDRDRRDQAVRIWKSAQDQDLIRGRSIEGLASAAIYAVGRIHELTLHLDDVVRVSRVGRDRIRMCYDVLNRELGLPTPPPRPATYVGRICSDLGCSADVRRLAEGLAARHSETHANKAVKPHGVAGAAVYVASQRQGFGRTQADVADEAGTTTYTMRKRIPEIEGVLDDA